jgi:glycosyltransferase involved in cell wall biosynthesis
MPYISLIVTTYNWAAALDLVLASLAAQQANNFEVIIADDGSLADTKKLIQQWQTIFPVPLKHCWHEDLGFRAGAIRNRAVSMAEGEYLIFLDGDCIVQPSFVKRHQALSKKGWFVSGNRILCSQKWTVELLKEKTSIFLWPLTAWRKAQQDKKINRWHSLLSLPLGFLRYCQPHRWQGAKTSNLAIWRSDFISVNGFDERFQGWGFEDSDLVIRLQNNKICHKQGRYAVTVIHLWHPEQSRQKMGENWDRLLETKKTQKTWAAEGVEQYL